MVFVAGLAGYGETVFILGVVVCFFPVLLFMGMIEMHSGFSGNLPPLHGITMINVFFTAGTSLCPRNLRNLKGRFIKALRYRD